MVNLDSGRHLQVLGVLPSVEPINAINEDSLRLRLTVLYQFLQQGAVKNAVSYAQIVKVKIRDSGFRRNVDVRIGLRFPNT